MHGINTNQLLELLDKRRQGKLLPDEQRQLDAWFDGLQHTDTNWYTSKADERLQLDSLWQNIYTKTAIPQDNIRRMPRLWWAAAAVLAGAITWIIWPKAPSIPDQPVVVKATPPVAPKPVRQLSITAALGTVKQVKLPDGTTVFLNSGASLQYPETFGGKRNVTLTKGQAFFVVAADMQHPFIVESEGLQTLVLGTSFEVSLQRGKQMISLASGKVRVQKERELGMLLPGQRLTYTNQNGQTAIKPFKLAEVAAWRDKKIRLEQASFAELADAFHTIYGVRLKAADSLAREQTYTIVLQYNTGMKQMLDVLALIHHNEYEVTGSTVMIKTKP